jgi:hypothetical protein
MGRGRKDGEVWFETYLTAHGYAFEYEPDLGVPKRPDYLISRDGLEVVCEVEEFEGEPGALLGAPAGQKSGTMSMRQAQKPIYNKVRAGAKQLKPLEGRGWPLVVVLANPSAAFIDLRPDSLLGYALYGEPHVNFKIDTTMGGAIGPPEFKLGRHGKLTKDHPYISSVAVAHRREHAEDQRDAVEIDNAGMTRVEHMAALLDAYENLDLIPGEYYWLDTVRTMSTAAVPLPAGVFDGENDRSWEIGPGRLADQVAGRTFK